MQDVEGVEDEPVVAALLRERAFERGEVGAAFVGRHDHFAVDERRHAS